jgi:hypothetical protein
MLVLLNMEKFVMMHGHMNEKKKGGIQLLQNVDYPHQATQFHNSKEDSCSTGIKAPKEASNTDSLRYLCFLPQIH